MCCVELRVHLKPLTHLPDEMVTSCSALCHTPTGWEGLFGMLCVNYLFCILNFNTVSSGISFKSLYLSEAGLKNKN